MRLLQSRPVAAALLGLLLSANAIAGNARGRPVVSGGTLRTDQGTLLRAVNSWCNKYTLTLAGNAAGASSALLDPAYYDDLKAHRINAIRVCCTDAFQHRNGFLGYDWRNTADIAAAQAIYDSAFTLAGSKGLYVILNYHDVGCYHKEDIRAFWTAMAPRYANYPNVIYEIINEPSGENAGAYDNWGTKPSHTGGWYPENYNSDLLLFEKEIYDLVRTHAPLTHIMLFTFPNNHQPWLASNGQNSMLDVVNAFNKLTKFDWANANASVAFHPYSTGQTSASITQLKSAGYPVVNTEQNLPNYENAIPMDGEGYGQQTMERLGISWLAWTANGFGAGSQYATKFLTGPIADAQRKGYYWAADDYGHLVGVIGHPSRPRSDK